MYAKRLTGPQSGARKYDVLTCLSLIGHRGQGVDQMSAFRLLTLVTARYNWASDDLSLGQPQMARLWGVSERTAKREVKRLISLGFLSVKVPGARGRVARYALGWSRILAASEPFWPDVGPDFVERMREAPPAEHSSNVVPLAPVRNARVAGDDPWSRVLARMAAKDAARCEAWMARLICVRADSDGLHLEAPSAFVKRYIEAHMWDYLESSVAEHFGGPVPTRISLAQG